MTDYLFLYGTLLPGNAPDEIADTVRRLSPITQAFVRGRLYDLGEYPGAILDPSADTSIAGEVFELPDDQETLASLDSYEGFDPDEPRGSLFARVKSPVTLYGGGELQCWIYVYNRDPEDASLVADGNYAKWRGVEGDRAP
ncbi:MAG: gamma-glutamylcyclotransferase [Blastocatellia bacterium]|nr:gamma-glutamylcyclotransferase [Blastocatellia bacterium]